ncbi:MAG: hypothetical protein AB7S54_06675 [Bacteroidales bacterium]
MKNGFTTIIYLIISGLLVLSCDKEQDCKNLTLKTESLENLYGCSDTRYGLECRLDNDYEIIRSQQAFMDFTTGTCRPEIDFQSYDLIIGKKGLTSGNSSIDYELIDDCKKGIKILTVTFNQNMTTVAPNLTYHALIPKLGDEETIQVEINIKY